MGEGWVNMSEFKDAEKMFKFYIGSKFLMGREYDYEHYKKFNVPQEMENKWRYEMKGELFEKLNSTSNFRLIAKYYSDFGDIVSQLKDQEGFRFMMEYIKKNMAIFDSNTAMRTIRELIIVDQALNDGKLSLNIRNEALSLLRDALQKPIWISDDYFENEKLPDYLMPDTVKENIIKTIEYWGNLGNN